MADIRLRIEVNPNAETETLGTITNKVNDVGSNSNLSNVSFKASSSGVYADRSNTNEYGREMLSWANNGVLKFNSEDLLSTDGVVAGALASETDPDMFVWGAVPENKQYSVKLTFSNATSLKDIVVYGDKTANQFPTKAIIDGTKTIYSDDYQWAINMETESDTHTIEFVEWNRANYNACLTRIMVMLRYFDLDKGWIDSVESLTQSTSDPSSIQYGVLANSGSATIRDLDGELKDYIQDGIIPETNLHVDIIINNNPTQSHITNNTQYNILDKTVSLNFSNSLSKWKEISFNGFNLRDKKLSTDKNKYYTAYEILCMIFNECLGYNSNIVDNMLNQDIKNYLQDIQLEIFYMGKSSLYDAVNKICGIAQLSIYENNNGEIKFVSARPIITQQQAENAIFIKEHMKITQLQFDVVYKNKFNGIQTQKTIYKNHNKILQPFNIDVSHPIETKQSNAINASIWYSDYFEDENSIYQDDSYVIEDYTDSTGTKWKICQKKVSQPYNVRVLIYYGNSDKLLRTSTIMPLFYHNDKYQMGVNPISNYNNEANFKSFLKSQGVLFGFLSPDTPIANKYTETFQPIFAYEPDFISFPFQVFYVSSIIETSEGNKTATWDGVEITQEDSVVNNGLNTNLVNIDSNELISDYTTYNGNTIISVIGNNIISDYKNGISTASIDVFAGDLYNSSGEKIKNWNNGEILNLSDIVYFENDKYVDGSYRYWRVTGRNQKYKGNPYLSLELQEVKVVNKGETNGT